MANLQIRNTCNLRSTKDEHAFWLEGGQSNTALSPALVPLMQDHPSKYLGQNCFPFSKHCCTNYHMFPNFILIIYLYKPIIFLKKDNHLTVFHRLSHSPHKAWPYCKHSQNNPYRFCIDNLSSRNRTYNTTILVTS